MHERVLVPELMDDLDLDERQHYRALAGLRRINLVTSTGSKIATAIISMNQSAKISILDVACGGGDVAVRVHQALSGNNLDVHIVGCDMSKTACQVATRRAASAGIGTQVQFSVRDAFVMLERSSQTFDFIYCSLFLQHLRTDESVRLLKLMKLRATQGIVVHDLLRDPFGLLLARIGCTLLSRSQIVRFDGPQSVRAAFSLQEVTESAKRAGLDGASVEMHWPKRLCLTWLRNR